MFNSAFLNEFEKKAIGPIQWLRVAFPWIRKAMAVRRQAPVLGLSQKALKAGRKRDYSRSFMKWHGGTTTKELESANRKVLGLKRKILKTPKSITPLKKRPERMLQAFTGSILNPMYAVEKNVGLALKNPQVVSKLLGRHKASFLHKTWTPPKPPDITGPVAGRIKDVIARPKGLFLKRTPTGEGGSLYPRTLLGAASYAATGTGVGMGALDLATTEGSIGKKMKEGAKGVVKWGPLRNLMVTKVTGYDVPKMLLRKPPKPDAHQQAYWHKAANKK